MRLSLLHRFALSCVAGTIVSLTIVLFSAGSASAAGTAKKSKAAESPTVTTARQYVEALSRGEKVAATKRDFACLYPLVVASPSGLKSFPADSDAVYDTCWNNLKAAHAPTLVRSDLGMEVLWPSQGDLVFFSEELSRYPASAFVADSMGLSPPGTGLRIQSSSSRALPAASFRLRPNGKVVAVPATLVSFVIHYQDPLTSPLTYAAGTYKWANTIKRARRALKDITVQWVVLSGLKKHGFPNEMAVVNLPVTSGAIDASGVQERIPFTTEVSRALPESRFWWGPDDLPGVLTAATARAATFPELRDRVAMLNRILIIDPNQPDALTVLSRHLYAAILHNAMPLHQLVVKDPALSLVVNEHYWNIYAQATRVDLSLGMEMGGFDKPTTADYLYRLLGALRTLVTIRPEQLDNQFRLGVALRWNNDQDAAIETHQALVKAVPTERKSGKAEALLQLAWSHVNKVAWNRNFDDPDVMLAFQEADEALKIAEVPLDRFLAEYTKAYSLLFTPKRDNQAILGHLTEAKRWFAEVPGHTQEIWNFFIGAEQLKSVLDADPIFQPLLASSEEKKP